MFLKLKSSLQNIFKLGEILKIILNISLEHFFSRMLRMLLIKNQSPGLRSGASCFWPEIVHQRDGSEASQLHIVEAASGVLNSLLSQILQGIFY